MSCQVWDTELKDGRICAPWRGWKDRMALIRFRYNSSSSLLSSYQPSALSSQPSFLLPYTSPVPVASQLITSTSLHFSVSRTVNSSGDINSCHNPFVQSKESATFATNHWQQPQRRCWCDILVIILTALADYSVHLET